MKEKVINITRTDSTVELYGTYATFSYNIKLANGKIVDCQLEDEEMQDYINNYIEYLNLEKKEIYFKKLLSLDGIKKRLKYNLVGILLSIPLIASCIAIGLIPTTSLFSSYLIEFLQFIVLIASAAPLCGANFNKAYMSNKDFAKIKSLNEKIEKFNNLMSDAKNACKNREKNRIERHKIDRQVVLRKNDFARSCREDNLKRETEEILKKIEKFNDSYYEKEKEFDEEMGFYENSLKENNSTRRKR